MQISIYLPLVALGLAACGSPSAGELQAVDGTWNRYHDDGNIRDQFAFNGDETFSFDEYKEDPADEDHVSGTYVVDEQELVMETQGGSARTSFYVNDGELLIDTFLPEQQTEGGIGRWQRTSRQSAPVVGIEVSEQTTVDIAADGTATWLTISDSDVVEDLAGTWEFQPPRTYRVSLSVGGAEFSMDMELVDGSALGGTLYERAP